MLWTLIGLAVVVLAIRRRWRLAIYLWSPARVTSRLTRCSRTWWAGNANGNLLGDHTIPHWFAARRTPNLNHLSLIVSNLGATQDILIVSVVTCAVFLAITRRWRPVIFLAVVMFGELAAFLVVADIVRGHPRDSLGPPTR